MTYTLQQQAFALSMIASAGATDVASPSVVETDLEETINAFLDASPPPIGPWSIAWGPVVTEYSPNIPSNAMFVAESTEGGNPVYVVAIAATNLSSHFDVVVEDVGLALTWPSSSPVSWSTPPDDLSPHVTTGTIDGVDVLLEMVDPFSPTSTLVEFLATVADTSATLVFTGHSLGGALAPALALALFGAGDDGLLSRKAWGNVYLYPTAGPTVGDQDYAEYWNRAFPPVPGSATTSWNQLVWNTMDVVPHAWWDISALWSLYTSQINLSLCLDGVILDLEGRTAKAGGTFVQPNNVSVPGTLATWSGASDKTPMFTYFLIETLYQHTYAYFELLGVADLLQDYPFVNTLPNPMDNPDAPTAVVDLCSQHCPVASDCGSSSAG
jgi:hypothetical protein